MIGAAVGAVVGGAIAYGVQVHDNLQKGKSNPWGDVNWGDVVTGAAIGGLIGATLGAAAPSIAAAFSAGVTAYNAGLGFSGIVTMAYTAFKFGPALESGTAPLLTKNTRVPVTRTPTITGTGSSGGGGGPLSASGIRNTLNNARANVIESDNPQLTWNDNRVYLGHYGGNGIIVNGVDYPASGLPGLNTLEGFARQYGGKVLSDLPGTIEAMQPEIEKANEILFNIGRAGLAPGSLTAQEFQFLMGNPSLIQKTIFLFGATY